MTKPPIPGSSLPVCCAEPARATKLPPAISSFFPVAPVSIVFPAVTTIEPPFADVESPPCVLISPPLPFKLFELEIITDPLLPELEVPE